MLNKSSKPRVLMVAPVFYPYPPIWPEGMVNAKLALAFKSAGWHIDVIVAGYPEGSSRYPAEETKWVELSDNIYVIPYGQQSSVLQRIMNAIRGFALTHKILNGLGWGLSVLSLATRLHTDNRYDIILSRAIPDTAHFAALLVHRKLRIPWIANWNDPTPNHKFPPPYGKGHLSPLASNTRKWYSVVCKHCSWHTFPSERMRAYMCSYLPGSIFQKSSVIPHLAMKRFSVEPIPHDGFSMCYAGSVLPPRNVGIFFEGIKRFKRMLGRPEQFVVRFLVDKPELVMETAKALGIDDVVRVETTVPYSKMSDVLAQSDVLVIIEAQLEESIFLPSKIADYVQTGRPILAVTPAMGAIRDVFSMHGGGIAVDCRSPDAVATALKDLFFHWKAGTLESTYGSGSLNDYLGEEQIIKMYENLFERLLSKPGL